MQFKDAESHMTPGFVLLDVLKTTKSNPKLEYLNDESLTIT